MVIFLDEYRKAKAAKPAEHARYDEDLLCANWNPAVGLVAMACYQTERELSPQLPEDLSAIDVPAFLHRVYALATQV